MSRAIILILAVCARLSADDQWPEFLGPSHNNHAASAALPTRWSETENVKWRTAIPGEGWSSPVIWDDQIWLTTSISEGHSLRALCVNKTTGRIDRNIEVFAPSNPGYKNSFNSYASPTPAIETGRVYVCFGTNGSACIDTATGQILWRNTDLKVMHMEGAGSSPILYKDLYILNCDGIGQQYVAALDKKTGQAVWKTRRSTDFGWKLPPMRKAYSVPLPITVDGREQLISIGAYNCIAYDPLTGKELWSCKLPGYSNAARPVYGNELLFVSTGYTAAQLWAIRPGGSGDVAQTNIAWRFSQASCLLPTPLFVDGRIYMPLDSGIVRCLDAMSGQQIWQARLGTQYVSSPLYARGMIYLSSLKGVTVIVKVGDKPDVIAENRLDGRFMASPAVSGGALFLRTNTHLYRIEE
ncbi:MAG: PQQ-binding-like beta-propeller repeat protein [Planctomycetota bacterium]|nr:PQQ-binding-like beta-propeller repeat protein [Planctomycetota bacterium]